MIGHAWVSLAAQLGPQIVAVGCALYLLALFAVAGRGL